MQEALRGQKVVAVNAASAYHAGGGFQTGGRHALEEAMCGRLSHSGGDAVVGLATHVPIVFERLMKAYHIAAMPCPKTPRHSKHALRLLGKRRRVGRAGKNQAETCGDLREPKCASVVA